MRRVLLLIVLCSATAAAQQAGGPPVVTSQDLLAGLSDPTKWLLYHGNYSGHRHSPLTQITPENVNRLTAQWTFQSGVLGSFHAYHACRKGLKVLLLEKDSRPSEATVRNFGQVVPSGMKQGQWQDYGRRSIEIYEEIHSHFDITVRKNGTVYIASDSFSGPVAVASARQNPNLSQCQAFSYPQVGWTPEATYDLTGHYPEPLRLGY